MNDAYAFGLENFKHINKEIHGHICMTEMEAATLAQAIYEAGDGDHLEIGTMWGGTAILAALIKKAYELDGSVVVIDPFCDADAGGHGKPDADVFWSNAKKMGVEDRLELVQEYSYPFPIEGRRFASVLIDGNHHKPWPRRDWDSVKEIAGFIIFHDINERDVKDVVKTLWSPYLTCERIAVLKA